MRRTLCHTIEISAPPDQVFPMFTPEGERSWVAGWDPQFVPADSAPSRMGSVFRTSHDGEQTLWMVAELDGRARTARYVRHTEGSRMALVSVECHPCAAGTRVQVTYDVTALSPAGEQSIRAFEQRFTDAIGSWKTLVEAALSRP